MGIELLQRQRYIDTCSVGTIDTSLDRATVHFYSCFYDKGVSVPLVELEIIKGSDVERHDRFKAIISLLPETPEALVPTFLTFIGEI